MNPATLDAVAFLLDQWRPFEPDPEALDIVRQAAFPARFRRGVLESFHHAHTSEPLREAIMAAANDDSPDVRWEACCLLGEPRDIPVLLRRVGDPGVTDDGRSVEARALETIYEIKSAAWSGALGSLGSPSAPRFLRFLLQEADADARVFAIRELEESGGAEDLAVLEAMRGDSARAGNGDVVDRRAAIALRRILGRGPSPSGQGS